MDGHTHGLAELKKIASAKDTFENNPELFIRRVSGSDGRPADPYYLHAISCHIDFERNQRTVQFFEALVRMVLNGYLRPENDPLHASHGRSISKPLDWEAPFRTIMHMMVDIGEDEYQGPDDRAIMEIIAREWAKILAVVSRDLSVFVGNEVSANDRRHNVIGFLRLIAAIPGIMSTIRTTQAHLDLLLTCWAGIMPPLRAEARALVATIFDVEGADPTTTSPRAVWHEETAYTLHKDQRRVGAKNIPMLLSSFKRWLGEPTIIDFSLEWELGCIATLLEYDDELCDAFFAAQRDEDVLAALQRQKMDGGAASLRTVTSVAFRCLHMMSPRVFPSAVIGQLSANSLEMAFSCVCRDVANNKSKDEVFKSWWSAYINLLFRVLLQDPDEPREWTQELEDELRNQVEAIYIPMQTTIIRLRDAHLNSEALSLLEHMWRSLCARLDVSEVVAWRRASSATTCSNPSCAAERDAGVALKRCSRCKAVRYCSGPCQNAHWNQHKVHCEITPALLANVPDYHHK